MTFYLKSQAFLAIILVIVATTFLSHTKNAFASTNYVSGIVLHSGSEICIPASQLPSSGGSWSYTFVGSGTFPGGSGGTQMSCENNYTWSYASSTGGSIIPTSNTFFTLNITKNSDTYSAQFYWDGSIFSVQSIIPTDVTNFIVRQPTSVGTTSLFLTYDILGYVNQTNDPNFSYVRMVIYSLISGAALVDIYQPITYNQIVGYFPISEATALNPPGPYAGIISLTTGCSAGTNASSTPQVDIACPSGLKPSATTTEQTIDTFSFNASALVQAGTYTDASGSIVSLYSTSTPTSDSLSNSILKYIRDLLVSLFQPTNQSLNQYQTLYTTVIHKVPFGYVSTISTALSTISATSSTSTVQNYFAISLVSNFFTPIRTGLIVILWFAFGFFLFKRFQHFQL